MRQSRVVILTSALLAGCGSYKDDVRLLCASAKDVAAETLTRDSFGRHLDRMQSQLKTASGIKLVAGFSGIDRLEQCGELLEVAATQDVKLSTPCALADVLVRAGALREREAEVAKERIRGRLDTTTAAAHQCLEAARKDSPKLAGLMVLRIKLDRHEIEIRRDAEAHFRHEGLERCLARIVKNTVDPLKPEGGHPLALKYSYDFR